MNFWTSTYSNNYLQTYFQTHKQWFIKNAKFKVRLLYSKQKSFNQKSFNQM